MYSNDEIEYRLDQKLHTIEDMGFTIVPFISHSGKFSSEKIIETFIEDIRTNRLYY
jgi:hypothetical protein